MPDTIKYFIENLVGRYGRRPALTMRKEFRTETWSYADLHERAHQIGWLFFTDFPHVKFN